MIQSFGDRDTFLLFTERKSKHWRNIQAVALRKLDQMAGATRLEDLSVPSGNRLEALRGDRIGQHSLRINREYRICFVWREEGAYDVEIVDYHQG